MLDLWTVLSALYIIIAGPGVVTLMYHTFYHLCHRWLYRDVWEKYDDYQHKISYEHWMVQLSILKWLTAFYASTRIFSSIGLSGLSEEPGQIKRVIRGIYLEYAEDSIDLTEKDKKYQELHDGLVINPLLAWILLHIMNFPRMSSLTLRVLTSSNLSSILSLFGRGQR